MNLPINTATSGITTNSAATNSAAASASDLPTRLRLAPGRTVLWRSPTCLQFGVDPRHAMILDDLPEPLATLLQEMDGIRSTAELLATAESAGSAPDDGVAMLTDLQRAGLVQDATAADSGPAGWHRHALAVEATGWSVHTTRAAHEVLRRRCCAGVRVIGSGRTAVAVATALASAGVGRVTVDADGTVTAGDLGTGYLPDDLGRPRADAAADAVRRVAPGVDQCHPTDLTVLTDVVVPDPALLTDLLADRIPHLISYCLEGTATVGPLVWPGRSSCLRCAEFHRADLDPVWPKLAAQLVGQTPAASVASTLITAALTAEQVLAILTGPGAGLPVPPTWGATLELDPVRGRLRRVPRPAHPRCGCGAC